MPANAVDEWPEGNDFLPSSIADASLYVPVLISEAQHIKVLETHPVQSLVALSHLQRARKSGRNLPRKKDKKTMGFQKKIVTCQPCASDIQLPIALAPFDFWVSN